jgi:hypothetical protein
VACSVCLSCRSIAVLLPPLANQLAVAAAAATQHPALLSKLQDIQSALDSHLTAAAASAAAAAAAAAHSLDTTADLDDADYSDVEDEAAAEASRGGYRLPLAQHWLVGDAVAADAGAAWQAYQALLAHMQLIAERWGDNTTTQLWVAKRHTTVSRHCCDTVARCSNANAS